MIAKISERLAVIKQTKKTFCGERFNLRNLNELEVRQQYQTESLNITLPTNALIVCHLF